MWRDAGSLVDMLKAARKVVEYATGLDESSFLASSRDQDAILRQLTIVGEQPSESPGSFALTIPRFRGGASQVFAMSSCMTTSKWTLRKSGKSSKEMFRL